jgi:hypothetical protein
VPQRNQLVVNGLRYWKRPILRYAGGDRAFLITLACEGGLPLQLLHNENAKLHRYFKAILEDKQTFHNLPTERLAEQCKHHLPQSLHREMVDEVASKDVLRVDFTSFFGYAESATEHYAAIKTPCSVFISLPSP